MPPPPAETVASRLFLGPALRTQPDRRLVTLVRDGYETAFEEIVRRYGKPLDRYATAIVGSRAEDVTQDAFSKALLALRRDGSEIELRPWLYRIVRNTALNDLRDRPPSPQELDEAIEGGRSASEEAERREEITELMTRLRALPEAQRAAIVMRELEGLSHDEIAAALGVSGGAARQAIHRARMALRDGLGMLVPLPLLRLLIDHGTETAAAGVGGGAAVASGASIGGAGASGALKLGVAAALIGGSFGAGVALHEHDRNIHTGRTATEAAAPRIEGDTDGGAAVPAAAPDTTSGVAFRSRVGGDGHGGPGHRGDDNHGRGSGGHGEPEHGDGSGGDGRSSPPPPGSLPQGDGPESGGPGPRGSGDEHPSEQGGKGGHTGRSGPGPGSGEVVSGGDNGSGGKSGSGHGPGGKSSGHGAKHAPVGVPLPPPPIDGSHGSGGGSDSGSGSSGSGEGLP